MTSRDPLRTAGLARPWRMLRSLTVIIIIIMIIIIIIIIIIIDTGRSDNASEFQESLKT